MNNKSVTITVGESALVIHMIYLELFKEDMQGDFAHFPAVQEQIQRERERERE